MAKTRAECWNQKDEKKESQYKKKGTLLYKRNTIKERKIRKGIKH